MNTQSSLSPTMQQRITTRRCVGALVSYRLLIILFCCVELFFFFLRKWMFHAVTCRPSRLSSFSWTVMLGGTRGQSVHLLEGAALFTPHMVDLHGCFTLCYQIQVLLGQVSPQLPDLKLKGKKKERQNGRPEGNSHSPYRVNPFLRKLTKCCMQGNNLCC